MALISKQYSFSAGATIIASEHNSNFDTLYSEINGNLSNANISNSAAIAYSKLALSGSILNADINASAAIAYSKLNLTGTVVNADIGASAAIVDTKLAAISTAGKVSGASLTSLSSIPSGAGVIPSANLPDLELPYETGSFIESSATTERSTNSTSYAKLKEFTPMARPGVVSVVFDMKSDTNSVTATARIYVNGVAVGTEQTEAVGSYETKTEDVTVAIDDVVQVYGKSVSQFCFVRNLYIKCANPTLPAEATGL